jgi:hypothetical protein
MNDQQKDDSSRKNTLAEKAKVYKNYITVMV